MSSTDINETLVRMLREIQEQLHIDAWLPFGQWGARQYVAFFLQGATMKLGQVLHEDETSGPVALAFAAVKTKFFVGVDVGEVYSFISMLPAYDLGDKDEYLCIHQYGAESVDDWMQLGLHQPYPTGKLSYALSVFDKLALDSAKNLEGQAAFKQALECLGTSHIFKQGIDIYRGSASWLYVFKAVHNARDSPGFRQQVNGRKKHDAVCFGEAAWKLWPPRTNFKFEDLKPFPWRLALAEVVIKLGIQSDAAYLGKLVARLERYPSWQPALREEYKQFSIQKRSGGTRTIQVPSPTLKALQRRLYRLIAAFVDSHPSSHGFENARSIFTNGEPHCAKSTVARFDIKGAFENTSRRAVENALKRDLGFLSFSNRAIRLLGELFTYEGGLPTGAPSSPFLLNRVLFEVDESLSRTAHEKHVGYSRYADDLTFSGDGCLSLEKIVKAKLSTLGYELNSKKTRIYRSGHRQIVTGLVVNCTPNLPRETRRNLRAATHRFVRTGRAVWNGVEVSDTVLKGHIAYYMMTNKEAAIPLLRLLESRISAAGDNAA